MQGNNPNDEAKEESLFKDPSVSVWLTGESECVAGSDEKCIWAFLMRAAVIFRVFVLGP